MTVILSAVVGLGFASVIGWWLIGSGLYRRSWLLSLLAVPFMLSFPIMAWAGEDFVARLGHQSALPIFAIMAGAGLFWGPTFALIALIGHGGYSLLIHVQPDPSPDWWPVTCGTFEITLAALLFWAIFIRDRVVT